jgi:hypothetical protein
VRNGLPRELADIGNCGAGFQNYGGWVRWRDIAGRRGYARSTYLGG